MAIVLSFRFPSKCCFSFLYNISFWISLTLSTAFRTFISYPCCLAVFIKAFTSLGKQLPPYPHPGYKNLFPILESLPIPFLTILTSAPINSQRLAISFIKDILVASIEFAAYFIISAEGISVIMIRSDTSIKGLYNFDIISRAFILSTPITTLSGLIKSFIAAPSFKNSGLEATSNSTEIPRLSISSRITFFTFLAVPTGTVLLVTITIYFFMYCPMV